ncbi:MAG TPA: MMPL family transporter [Pyrinomonadaceae bacterium]|jgi:hypothetical protein
MLHILKFSVRHPRLVLTLIGLVTCLFCFFIPRIQLRLDGRSLIPANMPDFIESDKAAARFGLRDYILIGVGNEEAGIYRPESLQRIVRLTDELAGVEGVVEGSVYSLSTVPRLSVASGQIDTHPLLRHGIEWDAEKIRALRREISTSGLDDGVLISVDGKAAMIMAQVETGADRYRVLERTRELIGRESTDGDAIYLSGTALAQAVLGQSSARDLARLIPVIIIVLSVMLFLAFRHPMPALLSLTEIGVSLIWMAGLLGMTGQPVFVTTLILPVILIAVGISDDVYALSHYFSEARRTDGLLVEETTMSAFSSAARPIALTSLSTIVGLLSIAITSLNPLRVFGIFGSAAILFSTLFTFSLLPALLILFKPRLPVKAVSRETGWTGKGSAAIGLLLERMRPWRIAVIALIITACAALLTTRLKVDDAWIKNLPADSDIARGDKFFNSKLAGTVTLELMLDAGQRDEFSSGQGVKALGEVERAVAGLPYVSAVHSLYSDVVQVNAAIKEVDYKTARNEFQQGRADLSNRETEQALLLLSTARRQFLRENVEDTFRRARLTVFIKDADYLRIDGVLRAAAQACADHAPGYGLIPFGDGWVSYLTVRLLVEGQLISILLALLTDVVLITVFLKSLRLGAIAILPVAFSLLVIFATLAATGTSLGIANSMFAGIALGIGLDFSIHLTTAYQQKVRAGMASSEALARTLEITAPAICISAISITAGFVVLTLSEIAPNVQLGLMICLCLLTCAVATLLLVPAMLRLGREGRIKLSTFRLRLLGIVILSLLASSCSTKSVDINEPAAPPKTGNASALSRVELAWIEPLPERDAPDTTAVVNAYNSRPVGSPGWRRVSLNLINGTEITKSFTVVNVWKAKDDEARTLFYLEEPRGLSGTSYLLIEGGESAQQQDMTVHLFLPAGERRVLEIMPENFAEGLLGSDFTYADLRMRLPTGSFEYRLIGQAVLRNEPAWAIEARPLTQAARQSVGWSRAHLYLAKRFPFLLGADYFGEAKHAGDSPPVIKRLRVESFKQGDGTWTPTRMVMFGSGENSSVLTLKDARFNLKEFDAGILTPAELPSLAGRLGQMGGGAAGAR